MILACVENISSCTKYKTVSSPKVSAIITHLSQLTGEACGTSENGLWSRAAGSGSGPAATVWLWVDALFSFTPHLRNRMVPVPTEQGR